jgi:hypothetical protein
MKNILIISFTLLCLVSYGQELQEQVSNEITTTSFQEIDSLEVYKIKRVSLGIKLGIPNIAGFSAEAITPILGNRIAPYIDFSSFPVNTDETDLDLKYTEFGSNFYFGDNGQGFYVGVGFGTLNTDIVFKNIEFEGNGNRGRGTGTINTTNLKLGIKTGGRVYFRLEVGYGIGTIPQEITVNGTETEEFPSIPGVNDKGVLVGNFGFGISF